MRFYTTPHKFHCGIDLHTRTMYVWIVNQAGEVLVHRNMPAAPEPFLSNVHQSLDGLVNGNFLVPPCNDMLNSRLDRFDPRLNTRPRCGKKHDNGELPVSKTLLVSQILIRRNQDVVARLFHHIE
jgi:hypothetical protein